MAKNKSEKNSRSAVTASPPLSPESSPVSTQDDLSQSATLVGQSKIDPAEEPTTEPSIQDSPAKSPSDDPKEVVTEPKEDIESSPEPAVNEQGSKDPDPQPEQTVDQEPHDHSSDEFFEPREEPNQSSTQDKAPEPNESTPSDEPETLEPKTYSTEPVAESEIQEKSVPVSEPDPPEQKPDVEVAKDPDPPIEPEHEPVTEPEPKAVAEHEPEPVAEPQPEPVAVADPKPEPVAAPEPDPVAEPELRPEVESKKELDAEPAPIEAKSPPKQKAASPLPQPPAPEAITNSPRSVATQRSPTSSTRSKSSKPEAVNRVIDDNRPPAPTPPLSRFRHRRVQAFDDDDDEDSAVIQPRLRGEALSRESSRGPYPPPPHSRSLFASRVPVEHYTNHQPSSPPPPQPPPGYHPSRYYAPPSAPPYFSVHNHTMSQPGGYPNYPAYGPPSHLPSPYQETWGHMPPHYGPYSTHGPHQRHDSMASRDYSMGSPHFDNLPPEGDEAGDIFSRINQAIPDLHVLLAKYKETHGQLSEREEMLRRTSAEQEQKLSAKNEEILNLKEKISRMEKKHSSETGRLRLEIGNMEEQIKEFKEQVEKTEKIEEEAEHLRSTMETTMRSFKNRCKELEEAHEALEKQSAEDTTKAKTEFEEWKSTFTTKHDAEKIALAIQFDKKLKEADVLAENQRQEAAAAFVKEKDELRSEHQRQQREREENFTNVRTDLEAKLAAAQLDAEQALKRERESMEIWAKERGTLVNAHQEDIESLRKSWEEQRTLLETQHKKIKDESDKAWIELHAEANRKAEEQKAIAEQLAKEKDELQELFSGLKADTQREREIIKSVAANLELEKSRLERLMECYGDIAEMKSKGDTYYLVSFSQLQKQILDLAATHFVHLPVKPPADDLAQIPSTLPSFLGDTVASRQLRVAYVTHTVSKLVTYRVFGPFLFSLGRRYDKADSFFQSMSKHIREKSTRKEAIWRQQTLLAAFTSSGAKQRINTAAGAVVDEIVNTIKNFADPKEEEGIRIAVKRIVKLAAETWRFARLESELITATMPAVEDEDHTFTGPEYWAAHKPEGTPIASLAGTAPPSDEKPKLLLRLFPVIYREPKHEKFRSPEDERPDEGCFYHHGLALYDDAEPVVQRIEELKATGLPPATTVFPTATDFPPPLVPAPRSPPPTAPESVDNISIPSKSPPPSSPPPFPQLSARAPSEHPGAHYSRPPPGPINFSTSKEATLDEHPAESVVAPPSEAHAPSKVSISTRNIASIAPDLSQPKATESPPSTAPTDGASAPDPPSAPASIVRAPLVMPSAPMESAILPQFPPLEPYTREGSSPDLPTPPRSPVAPPPRPASPLVAAIHETEASKHRRKHSSSRRIRRSDEELHKGRADTARHSIGYSTSTRSTDQASWRTDRSSNNRFAFESRSAAIKGLYPNSALAGSPTHSRSSSIRSNRRSKSETGRVAGTWSTDSQRLSSLETNQQPAVCS